MLTNIAWGQVDYSVYANIIYRFTKYVNWPESRNTDNFIIGIVGETPLYEELKLLTRNKRAGNRPIVVKRILANAKMPDAHILFIAEDESSRLKNIAEFTAGRSVLIVTERQGLINRGSCINFIIVGDHLKLEFGKTNIERRHLDIASELLNLGAIVN